MTRRRRAIFFGTPEFAVPVLQTLARLTDVVTVVTRPDRPRGRGRHVESPPVKTTAMSLNLRVVQPDVINDDAFVSSLRAFEPDFLVTAAYGRIFGRRLLGAANIDCLNVHASLLPDFRGAAPANWAIIRGDRETGVSIMRMEAALDSGPIFATRSTEIGEAETAGQLVERLAVLGAEALGETLERYESIVPTLQDHGKATFAPGLKKHDGALDFKQSAKRLDCLVRGVHPWPCATATLGGIQLKIHASRVLECVGCRGEPGYVLAAGREGIDVACGEGVLRLLELQAPSKKRLKVGDFLLGNEMVTGCVFT